MNIKDVIFQVLSNDEQWTPKFHNPSSASFKKADGKIVGKDLLSLYLKWTGVPASNPMKPEQRIKTKLGDGAHWVVANLLAKGGIKAQPEVKGKTKVPGLKYEVSFRVDGLHELDGELGVLEVKSVGEDQILGKGWGIRDKGPKGADLLQCICYFNVWPGVKKVRLLYIARDSGVMEEYLIDRVNNSDEYLITPEEGHGQPFVTELNWKGIIARWAELEKHLETRIPPLPEFKVWLNEDGKFMKIKQIRSMKYKSDWEAEYSSYRDYIYLDPKNADLTTYNAEFKRKGLL